MPNYESIIEKVAKEQGVDSGLLKVLAKHESSFNPDAISQKGARGVMQLMPSIVKAYGVKNVNDPYQNITAGAKLLKDNFKRTGNWKDAIGEYNAGPRNWKRNRSGVMAQSPKYYQGIFDYIDGMGNKLKNIPPIPVAKNDATMIVTPFMGGKFQSDIQKNTLNGLNNAVPVPVSQATLKKATDGSEGISTDALVSLYRDPSLTKNSDFIRNMFNLK